MAARTTSEALPAETDLELVARLRVAVARLNRQLRQQSGTGLPLSLQSALVTIEQRGPLSLGDLAAVEQIAPATVTKIVARLVEDGLAERAPDARDGRVTLVSLTRAGARQLADSRTRRNAYLATRIGEPDGPDADRLRTAAEVLEALARPPGSGA